jgi:hypothetical protein
MVIDARYNGWSWSLTAPKKARTPGSACEPLRASLMTLVSIKYIGVGRGLALTLEICVAPYIRHGGQQVGQFAAGWAQ